MSDVTRYTLKAIQGGDVRNSAMFSRLVNKTGSPSIVPTGEARG